MVNKCTFSVNDTSTRTNNSTGVGVKSRFLRNNNSFSNTNEVRLFGYNSAFGDDDTFSDTNKVRLFGFNCAFGDDSSLGDTRDKDRKGGRGFKNPTSATIDYLTSCNQISIIVDSDASFVVMRKNPSLVDEGVYYVIVIAAAI